MNNEAETIRPAEPVTGVESAAEIPAAAETAPPAAESGQDGQHKPSWEEILQDPDYRSSYDQAVQGIVKARLRGHGRQRRGEPGPKPAGAGGGLPPRGRRDRGAPADHVRRGRGPAPERAGL